MAKQAASLRRIFDATAMRMLAEFEETREAQHRPSKGTLREEIVLDVFLKRFLSRNVSVVGSGEVVSVDGDVSPQCDLLIVDLSAPFLIEKSGYRVAASESVFGVIEVKSNLTSAELVDAYEKVVHVKRMSRSAYLSKGLITRRVYGRTWEHFPLMGMIFAYDGAELETLGTGMATMAAKYRDTPELQVDSIWVLNRGSLTWADPGTHRINPAPEEGDAIQAISSNPGQVLLQMTAHLHAFLQSAFTPGLRILDYFGDASFGNHLMAWVPDEEGGRQRRRVEASHPGGWRRRGRQGLAGFAPGPVLGLRFVLTRGSGVPGSCIGYVVGLAVESEQADDGVAQGGHDVSPPGCVAGADLGAVLVEGDVRCAGGPSGGGSRCPSVLGPRPPGPRVARRRGRRR